ncbi:IS66 family transposase, partial [Vibrio splendidus]
MEKTPNINPESQDIAELQAMVKALMLSQEQKESQWQQERQSLLEQLNLAFDRQ